MGDKAMFSTFGLVCNIAATSMSMLMALQQPCLESCGITYVFTIQAGCQDRATLCIDGYPWDLVSERNIRKSYIAAVNPPRNCVLISHIVAHAFLLTDLRISWYALYAMVQKRTLYEAREHAWHCQCNCLS